MRLESHPQEEITSRSIACAGFALPCQTDDRSVAHACRNIDFQRFGSADRACAPTGRARSVVLRSAAATLWTSLDRLQRNRTRYTAMGFFQRERNLGLHIRSAHRK